MTSSQPGRNDPCPCGSNKKFKKCCGQHASTSKSHTNITPSDNLQQALRLHQAGLMPEAERRYREIIDTQKNNPDVLNLLGVLCHQTGRSQEGGELIQRALQFNPEHFDAATNLGNILNELGHIENAIGCYEHALQIKPDHALAHCNYGALLSRLNHHEQAIHHLRQALATQPNYPDAHFALGEALERNNTPEEAIEEFSIFLKTHPNHLSARLNLADCLKKAGRIPEAIQGYRELIRTSPDFYVAYNNLGNLLREQGELSDAEALFSKALGMAPKLAELHGNISPVLISQNRIDDALGHLDSALEIAPNYPEAHFVKGLALLVAGDFKHGWPEYEWRWQCRDFRSPRQHTDIPRWQGEQLAGKTLLVHAEQGLGDTLQFIRYSEKLAACGGKIVLQCQPSLKALLTGLPGLDQVFSQGEQLPPVDLQIPLLSLPFAFGTEESSIPATSPYLSATVEKIAMWEERLQQAKCTGLRTGLVWAGRAEHQNDRNRSASLVALTPLAGLDKVSFISLQKGDGEQALADAPPGFDILPCGALLNDFTDTAGLVAALDLVITVDTSVAHLAGAMGKPVWLMLPYSPDWRWLLDRQDSPWYPSMRLFRQPRQGDWESVVQQIKQALIAQTAAKPD